MASTVFSDLSITKEQHNSPDGLCVWEKLIAYPSAELAVGRYEGKFFNYVTVTCYQPGEKKWEVVKEWREMGLGYSVPDLLGWAGDGHSLYFHDSIIPDGCQPLGGFQQNLRELDLVTGEIVAFSLQFTGGLALSPDTHQVVYYDREPMVLGVFNFETGTEQRVPFDVPEQITYWDAGQFTWSPNSQNVLFQIRYGDPCFPTGTSIRLADFERDEIRILVEESDPEIRIVAWSEPDRVLIARGEAQVWLDPLSGKLDAP
jgi:hypothetical protein